jgi:signal peptidase
MTAKALALPRAPRRSRPALVATARMILTVAAVAAWIVLLRPAALGGPASYLVISGASMKPTLDSGDMVIARRRASYGLGDVIVYRIPAGEPAAGARVIHRIVGGSAARGYRTRGDNRREPDRWRPRSADIDGEQWVRLPWIGRLAAILGTPLALASLAGLLAFLAVTPRRRRSAPPPA